MDLWQGATTLTAWLDAQQRPVHVGRQLETATLTTSWKTPFNCSLAVPHPVDASPVRSPQAAHSLLARLLAGKRVVEIGTRNGDGISCFSRTALHATAIERDQRYCQLLEKRAAQLPATSRFEVLCEAFDGAPGRASTQRIASADVVTWWINGAADKPILVALARIAEHSAMQQGVQAVVLFDSKNPYDVLSWESLRGWAAWSETVEFDECELCRARFRQHHRDYTGPWATCNRAVGRFHVAGVPLHQLRSFNFTAKLPDIKEDWSRKALVSAKRHFGASCPSKSSPKTRPLR